MGAGGVIRLLQVLGRCATCGIDAEVDGSGRRDPGHRRRDFFHDLARGIRSSGVIRLLQVLRAPRDLRLGSQKLARRRAHEGETLATAASTSSTIRRAASARFGALTIGRPTTM